MFGVVDVSKDFIREQELFERYLTGSILEALDMEDTKVCFNFNGYQVYKVLRDCNYDEIIIAQRLYDQDILYFYIEDEKEELLYGKVKCNIDFKEPNDMLLKIFRCSRCGEHIHGVKELYLPHPMPSSPTCKECYESLRRRYE